MESLAPFSVSLGFIIYGAQKNRANNDLLEREFYWQAILNKSHLDFYKSKFREKIVLRGFNSFSKNQNSEIDALLERQELEIDIDDNDEERRSVLFIIELREREFFNWFLLDLLHYKMNEFDGDRILFNDSL